MPVIEGNLGIIGLPDIIQMECMAGRSGVIMIRGLERTGQIHYLNGDIIHIRAGDLTDADAMVELLGVSEGTFSVEEPENKVPRTNERNWQKLLMDCIVQRDEAMAADENEVAPVEMPVRAKSSPLAGLASQVPGLECVEIQKKDGSTLNFGADSALEYAHGMHLYLEAAVKEISNMLDQGFPKVLAVQAEDTRYIELNWRNGRAVGLVYPNHDLISLRENLHVALQRSLP